MAKSPKRQVSGRKKKTRSVAPSLRLNPLAAYIRAACIPASLVLSMNPAFAGPQGGTVAAGQGKISKPNANTTLINQQSHNLSIDWQSFNIAQKELVHFNQPSKAANALNRIHDQNPSQIFGSLTATGNVFLVNPNGVYFSPTARVSVGALTASTLDISTKAAG